MWENSSMPEAEVCFSMRIHCWQQEWVSSVQPTVVSFPPVVQPLCCLCLSFSTSLLHPPKPECMISRPKNELFLHFWTVSTNFPPCINNTIMPNKTYERITFFLRCIPIQFYQFLGIHLDIIHLIQNMLSETTVPWDPHWGHSFYPSLQLHITTGLIRIITISMIMIMVIMIMMIIKMTLTRLRRRRGVSANGLIVIVSQHCSLDCQQYIFDHHHLLHHHQL